MPMFDTSDVADLVARARDGDQAAWNDLVERFLPLVTSVINRIRLPASDADDVNQTVWLRLVEHLKDLREPAALPGWLATVARNEALRLIKVRGRSVPVEPERSVLNIAVDDHSDEELIRQERSAALLSALQELPEKRRDLLTLLLEDPPLSYREISDRLDIPIGYIGPTRARALAQLRETTSLRAYCLDEDYEPGRGGRHAAMG
jgi:RNA polymerase sigma factor (sigma-70 family)